MTDKIDIDRLIEAMSGYQGKPREAAAKAPRAARKAPASLPSPEALERAARAVREAVAAHTGRRRPVTAWKRVAAESLGVSRLGQEVWQAVLDRGAALHLFAVDSGLSYETLKLLDDPPPKTEPEPVPEPVVEVKPWTLPPLRPAPPPEQRRYIYHLACGHRSWSLRKRVGDGGEEETYCHDCVLKTPPDHVWLSVNRGVPIPVKRRRSDANPQGHCCDENGQYIGGLEGDCRFARLRGSDKPVCAYHKDRPLWGRKD